MVYMIFVTRKVSRCRLGCPASKAQQSLARDGKRSTCSAIVATKGELNKAAEARSTCQKLLRRLYGSGVDFSHSLGVAVISQRMSSLRQLELEVWTKEREAVALKASSTTFMLEVQHLNMLCEERKEAEDSLKKKWKKIEEFDAQRLVLKSIYSSLLRANMDVAAFWSQQQVAATEYASSTTILACRVLIDISNNSKDLIDNEVSAFYRRPDSMLTVHTPLFLGCLRESTLFSMTWY
ncbi:augmin subunit 5-like protein [Tanacetum coccineum]